MFARNFKYVFSYMFYEACFMMYILQDCNGFYCDSGSQFLVQVFAEAKRCSHLGIGF